MIDKKEEIKNHVTTFATDNGSDTTELHGGTLNDKDIEHYINNIPNRIREQFPGNIFSLN